MLCYISSLYIYHETIDKNLSLNQGCVWKEGMLLYRTKHDEFPLALRSSLAARHVEMFPKSGKLVDLFHVSIW